jgi:hypothetical protein
LIRSVEKREGWSLGAESNHRPPDSHSGVLTAELPQGKSVVANKVHEGASWPACEVAGSSRIALRVLFAQHRQKKALSKAFFVA